MIEAKSFDFISMPINTLFKRLPGLTGLTALMIPLLLVGAVTKVAFTQPAQNKSMQVLRTVVTTSTSTTTSSTTTTTTSTTIAPKPIPRVVTTVPSSEIKVATGDIWEALRNCESGGNYSINTGNGFFGAYQFTASTWNSMNTGYERADLAPPDVQDDAAKRLQARSGWGQWPACTKSLGLR